MGFRFRKRPRIIPGLFLNIYERGGSLSLGGGDGLTTDISRRDVRETIGLPGSGSSYTTKIEATKLGDV